jgi:hypothetical protein
MNSNYLNNSRRVIKISNWRRDKIGNELGENGFIDRLQQALRLTTGGGIKLISWGNFRRRRAAAVPGP